MNLVDRFIFPVPKASYSPETEGISFLNLGSFQIPIINFYRRENQFTVLYFHGNSEDLGDLISLGNQVFSYGYNFYSVEYPGYGLCEGVPSEESIYSVAEIIFHRLIKDKLNVIVVGRSIGTGPASELGSKYSHLIKCVILVSPFKSISHMAHEKVPAFASFVGQRFDNLSKAVNIKCPYLLIHGKLDSMVPFKHSVDLLNANKSEKKQLLLMDGYGHNNILEEKVVDKFFKFLNQWLK